MDRRGLGRGLGALFPGAATGTREAIVRSVSVEQIRPSDMQPRRIFDGEKLAELAQSVREHGILQPLLVRSLDADGSQFELIAGERRWRAAKEAGLAVVPVIVREYVGGQALEVALIENVQRQDIGPVEAARAFARLHGEFGMTQEQIAQRVGKSQPTIANALRLLTLPARILESLDRGEITEGHAKALLAAPKDEQERLFETILTSRAPVREAEQIVRLARERARREGREERGQVRERQSLRSDSDPNLAAVEEALQLALGTHVTVRRSGRSSGGTIVVEFYSDETLEGIVQRIIGPLSPE